MSNSDENRNVRRFGQDNRKDHLDRPKTVFPPDESADFDIDELPLPDEDEDALAALAALDDEFKPPVITPPEERYPPLRPPDVSSERIPQSDAPAPQPKPASNRSGLYNAITALMTVLTLAFIVWLAIVWNDPQSDLNLFPPQTPFVVITATPDDAVFAEGMPTPDEAGQIFVVITSTPAQNIPSSTFPFVMRDVQYLPNDNALGCDWWSIAGTVTDSAGNPLTGYRVQVTGEGETQAVFSGAVASLGAGAYELPLDGRPREAAFEVQLFDARGEALSGAITVNMTGDCAGNVARVDFVQSR